MTTEVYVSQNGLDYFRLDLMKAESILMKYVYKDTQDLSKIYSPYSQSFALQGSLHNQRVLGFLGETKILKSKTNNTFDCKIYNNGLLAKKGLLKVTEVRYEKGGVKSFTANFTNSMLSLKDRMGEDKVSDLPITPITIDWTYVSAKNYINQGINLADDGLTNFIIPFMSNNRVWQVADINDATKLDNIAYNPYADKNVGNFVQITDLSPAIQFRTIIDLIKSKYDLNIVMPLEEEDFYNDLYVYCNKLEESFNNSVYYDVINPFVALSGQGINLYTISANNFTNEFTVTKNYYVLSGSFEIINLNLNVAFFDVANLKSNENIKLTVIYETLDGIKLGENTNDIVNGGDSYALNVGIKDDWFIANDNEFKFKIKIVSNFPITWSNSYIELYYSMRQTITSFVFNSFVIRRSTNNNSSTMSMSKIDLFKSLPDLKVVDFLTSFFKTFNISIFETSPDDGRLYWLTPKDIQAQNKEYSSAEVDYTDYVIDDKLNKKIANDYNYYNFKHKTSKYKSNADYLRIEKYEYGQLTYPLIKPTRDLSEFKVETNFSIIPNSPVNGLIDVTTLYGFTNENPTPQPNSALRYKPNTDDFTIFFYNGQIAPRNPYLGYLNLYPNGTLVIESLNRVSIIGSVHKSGFNLGFGLIETATTESLYENYYKDQTERLLDPNTLQSTFTLNLPPTELVLNYANTNQGESNIPSGFRLQNDIIIGETRYSIIDATIDQTTGKTTLNLLNYV